MAEQPSALSVPGYIPFLVTMETDPTRFHGEHARTPALPGQTACEQLLAHLLTDLEGMFSGIGAFAVVMPGAVYDQTQILRPGLPIFRALREVRSGHSAEYEAPNRLALALDRATADLKPLLPDTSVRPGLLLNLPMLLIGKVSETEAIAEAMEHRFLEEGQLSAHSARALESHFSIAVNHARFMTLTDLRAMLKLQLEHFQFLGLWELLDAAIEDAGEPVSVTARGGQSFEYRDGAVHCRFESFDYWAQRGAGTSIEDDAKLAEAYVDWTREFRQYITTLDAHLVPLVYSPADVKRMFIERDYLVETSDRTPAVSDAEVTEHAKGDVGVIAVSVIDGGRQFNYYPMSASGLNALHQAIRARGLGPGGFSYPGRAVHDPVARRLIPDTTSPSND